jgi:pimeloyl-ACP methyl ester carboxylesterase
MIMEIRKAHNGAVEIAYEYFGSPDGMPLLLINGSGMQMVMWPEDLCTALVDRGFFVVRMDNRDSGLSTRFTQYDDRKRKRAYTMRDMAGDVIAVADAIGAERVHLVGASLGATIAQLTAIHHAERIASLTLLSAIAGSKLRLARPKFRTIMKSMKLMRVPAPDAEAAGRQWIELLRMLGSPDHPVDEEHWYAAGKLAYERGVYPQGSVRHTLAQLGARDLRRQLAALDIPTLVVEGEADPMMSWRAAKIVADAIPGAKFLLLPGVGHELPRAVWPMVLDEIAALAVDNILQNLDDA